MSRACCEASRLIGRASVRLQANRQHRQGSRGFSNHSRSSQKQPTGPISLFFGGVIFSPSTEVFNRLLPLARADASSTNSPPVNLAGTWIRDQDASDMKAYDHMLELLHLSGLQRTTALQLIEGLEVEQSEEGATIKFLTVVPFFKVTEELNFSKEVAQGRRDLRPGKQMARCQRIPKGLYVEMTWGEPLPGRLTETYYLKGDVLYVESIVAVADGTQKTVVVYRRSGGSWRPRFKFPGL